MQINETTVFSKKESQTTDVRETVVQCVNIHFEQSYQGKCEFFLTKFCVEPIMCKVVPMWLHHIYLLSRDI